MIRKLADGGPRAAAVVTMRALTIAVLFCTTWQGYRLCDDGHGYRSTEWQWQGRTIRQDSDGGAWTTWRWQDRTVGESARKR